jgi:hypothetical protein
MNLYSKNPKTYIYKQTAMELENISQIAASL